MLCWTSYPPSTFPRRITGSTLMGVNFHAVGPIFTGFQCQLFPAVEMKEEAVLGEPGSFADVLDARGGVALCTEVVQSRIEEPVFDSCLDSSFVSAKIISVPTDWYTVYQPVGILSREFPVFNAKHSNQNSFPTQLCCLGWPNPRS